ncbi:MAG TPA: FAD:protein FMN transferase [Arenibacter sp.]|nr:FAD:protein FMN transferase [Arenibacter sp.]
MNRIKIFLISIGLFVFPLFIVAQKKYEFSHQQMGTQIGLIFYASGNIDNAQTIAKSVFQRIDDLNATLSNYIEHSELNHLGKNTDVPVDVSQDLFQILKLSDIYSKKTNGAFDVTLGPLINLWKAVLKQGRIPTGQEITSTLKRTGYRNIEFPAVRSVILRKTGMQLDLGGIGKGFAADEAIKVLRENGINTALVDMGGDITVSGPPPNKEFWTLGFSYFNEKGEEVFNKVKLRDQAIATSGDQYQYTLIDGKRYSHIIDPKSGRALSNRIQVTTIAPNGAMADAYASALSVLGIKEGEKIVKETADLEVFIVEDVPGQYKSWSTPGFSDHIVAD